VNKTNEDRLLDELKEHLKIVPVPPIGDLKNAAEPWVKSFGEWLVRFNELHEELGKELHK
jgi:hypothetical protein